MNKADVIIVGGGIAGISCARALFKRGIDFILIEGSDSLGGRVRSDLVNGFVLDRGFQVFNSAYLQTLSLLGNNSLEFHSFRSGSLIKTDIGLYPICDPLREPSYLLRTLFSPIGTLADRLRMLKLRADSFSSVNFRKKSILEELLARGFSQSIIERFFRPFLGGIFLESELVTSSLAFKEVFANFSRGLAQLPTGGMGEISRRLVLPLPKERILLGRTVVNISSGQVQLEDGENLTGRDIVLALDVDSLKKLFPEQELPKSRTVACFYFESNPLAHINRFLVLNGSGKGKINNIAPLASVSPSYAPTGKELLSASVIASPSMKDLPSVEEITREVSDWFPEAEARFIASYTINSALPEQLNKLPKINLPSNIHLCGDIVSMERYHSASIENAVRSGLDLGERLYL